MVPPPILLHFDRRQRDDHLKLHPLHPVVGELPPQVLLDDRRRVAPLSDDPAPACHLRGDDLRHVVQAAHRILLVVRVAGRRQHLPRAIGGEFTGVVSRFASLVCIGARASSCTPAEPPRSLGMLNMRCLGSGRPPKGVPSTTKSGCRHTPTLLPLRLRFIPLTSGEGLAKLVRPMQEMRTWSCRITPFCCMRRTYSGSAHVLRIAPRA
eukprot:21631-Prymnesium_polylepis.2